MRYGLRTLMIVLIFGPPLLAWLVWPAATRLVDWVSPREAPVTPTVIYNGERIRKGKNGGLILELPQSSLPINTEWKIRRGKDGVEFLEPPPSW